ADAALRGCEVLVSGRADGVFAGIALALARGLVTPLEAEQARGRVKVRPDLSGFDAAGLVFVAEGEPLDPLAGVVRPRCVVAVCGAELPGTYAHARRVVGIGFARTSRNSSPVRTPTRTPSPRSPRGCGRSGSPRWSRPRSGCRPGPPRDYHNDIMDTSPPPKLPPARERVGPILDTLGRLYPD